MKGEALRSGGAWGFSTILHLNGISTTQEREVTHRRIGVLSYVGALGLCAGGAWGFTA